MNVSVSGPVRNFKSVLHPDGRVEIELERTYAFDCATPITVTINGSRGKQDLLPIAGEPHEGEATENPVCRRRPTRLMVLAAGGLGCGILLSTFLFGHHAAHQPTLDPYRTSLLAGDVTGPLLPASRRHLETLAGGLSGRGNLPHVAVERNQQADRAVGPAAAPDFGMP